MNYESLFTDILVLDPKIRFSGVYDKTGETRYGGQRDAVKTFLSTEESRRSNLLALDGWKLHYSLSAKTRKPIYAIEENEMVKT